MSDLRPVIFIFCCLMSCISTTSQSLPSLPCAPLSFLLPYNTFFTMPSETMHAIVIKKYGDVDHLVAEDVPTPGPPEGEDLLVK